MNSIELELSSSLEKSVISDIVVDGVSGSMSTAHNEPELELEHASMGKIYNEPEVSIGVVIFLLF